MCVKILHQYSLLVLSFFLCTSCSLQRKVSYAEDAFFSQQSDREFPSQEKEVNEITERDILLSMDKDEKQLWEKQDDESVEQWVQRIQYELHENRDLFLIGSSELRALEEEEEEYKKKLATVAEQNQWLENLIRNPTQQGKQRRSSKQQAAQAEFGAPFTIHLVLKDETLYSIAMRYYNDASKVKDILLWNQGWIRGEDDITAGTGLVLFFSDVTDKANQRTIETFLQKIKKNRE